MNLNIGSLADVYRVDYGVDETQHKVKIPLVVVLNGYASYRKCLLIK